MNLLASIYSCMMCLQAIFCMRIGVCSTQVIWHELKLLVQLKLLVFLEMCGVTIPGTSVYICQLGCGCII